MADIVGNRTLRSQWDETVHFNPERIFLEFVSVEDRVQVFTYTAFDRLVKRAANYLLTLGIQKGELVALHLHNTPQYLICLLALAQIGAVSVPLNEHYQLNEIRYIIQKAGLRRLIAESRSIGLYTGNLDQFSLDTLIQTEGPCSAPEVLNLEDGMASQPDILQEVRPLSSDDLAVILFTSGTTRYPKGAIYTHCNVIYGGLLHMQQIGMSQGDRFLSAMPCYHMDFQEMAVMPVICAGGTLIMVEHYSARRFWAQVCQHRANFTDTMSIMNRTMMLQPERPWEKNHCLKQIYFSMGLSEEERRRFEDRFRVRLLNSYGMTETVSAVTCTPLVGDQNWPSVGRPALSYDIKIMLEDGTEAPPKAEGEICVRGVPGRTLVAGYYHDDKATKALMDEDGWLHSGDQGYLDEDGWLFFLGRCGDMVKRSGENVSSLEVECTLTSNADIADAAVIGVPDPIRDQAVKAFVLLRQGCQMTEEDVIAYCRTRLAKFKVPSIVEFVTNFPRTATGKIKKQLLR